MAAVVASAALGLVSISIAALAGAVAMVLARCIDVDNLYDAIDGRILLMMAGLLPLGTAVNNSGAAQFIVPFPVNEANLLWSSLPPQWMPCRRSAWHARPLP